MHSVEVVQLLGCERLRHVQEAIYGHDQFNPGRVPPRPCFCALRATDQAPHGQL